MSRRLVMPGRNLFHVNATEDAYNTLVAYMSRYTFVLRSEVMQLFL